jgi:predicted Zn-dependent peptidase
VPRIAVCSRASGPRRSIRAIGFENSGAVARYAAQQTIVYRESVDPDAAIDRLDEVTFDDVRAVAAGIQDELSLACVGPHTVAELEAA